VRLRGDALSDELLVERDHGVVRLTINREAKRNALSGDVMRGLLAALREVGDGDRVVLVTGAGDRVFCSGADLAQMAPDATGLEQHEGRGLLRDVVLAMRACPVPVVARVQGMCLAGGMGLAMGCDIVLASSDAVFGLPEVNLGLWPFMVSALLSRHVSPKRAMDLMVSGERIDAHQAYAAGLVSRVFDAASYDADVDAYIARLLAAAPVAIRLGKAAFQAAEETALAPALEAMQAQLSLLTTTKDVTEGLTAFFEKRAPRWSGR
jgi:enoyl-CoA hydratase